jgi:multisubunit Na+/H+ antiporter MnhG subunit
MDYQLLYDVSQPPTQQWVWGAIGLLLAAAGGFGLWRARRRGRRQGVAGMLAAIGTLLALLAGAWPLYEREQLVDALAGGRAQVAEGPVSAHVVEVVARRRAGDDATRVTRTTWEAFIVGTTPFGFYRDASRIGFTNAGAQAALGDGQRLRLHFVDDVPGDFAQRRILRVERARACCNNN